jgi:hypothetical protein
MKRSPVLLAATCLFFCAAPALASWKYTQSINPMTDADESMAYLMRSNNEFVAVRCQGEGRIDIMVAVDEYLGPGERYPVDFRVDKNDPSDGGEWRTDNEGLVVFVPESLEPEMLGALKTRREITFQVTTENGSKPYANFSLSGSSEAISKLGCLKK